MEGDIELATKRHSAKSKAKAARVRERAEVRALASGKSKASYRGDNDLTDPGVGYGSAVRTGRGSRAGAGPTGASDASARDRAAGVRTAGGPAGSSGAVWEYSRPVKKAKRRSRKRTWLAILAAFVAFVLIVGIGGWVWINGQISPAGPAGRPEVISVPQGATGASVADLLSSKRIITHPLVLRLYMKVHPIKVIDPGPYQFHANESFAAIEKTLESGPNQLLLDFKLTTPEGLTVGQIAQKVGALSGHNSAKFLQVVNSGQVLSNYKPASGNMEGLLFPDTYFISPNETELEIAQQMADRFDQIASTINLNTGAAQLGMTPYQVIVVASIIQREALVPSDMGKVAEVIYNRLKEKMKLQIDSTLIYALATMGQTVTSEITNAQGTTNSPYNTYLVAGLPPGPISAPGKAALQAALNPTPGPWLYYVTVDKQGDEAFSTSLAGQNANIAIAHKNGLPG